MSAPASTWTPLYCGVTHLGQLGRPRVSVCDYGSFAELHCWYLGCGFSPIERQYPTVDAAKADGEAWLRGDLVLHPER